MGRKMRGGRELEKSENKTWSESAHNSLIPDQSHKQLQEWLQPAEQKPKEERRKVG